MSSPLTAAEAWALAAKVALVDSMHCDPQESAAKRDEHAALLCRARECLMRESQAYLETPVQPAAHYATPMSGSEFRHIHQLRAALKRKPTKRRGTKPSSLPQRLAAACHTLKEP